MKKFTFNDADKDILRSFLIFPYLTADQVCRLHYSEKSLKYVMARLAWLSSEEEHYVHRTPKEKLYPHLYSIALRGTRKVEEVPIFYPLDKKIVHTMHYPHLLLTNEILMSVLKFPQVFPDINLLEIHHDLAIHHMMTGVRPDGWFDLRMKGEQIPIWLEVHYGSKPHEPQNKDKPKFQTKIAAILDAVKGTYRDVFHTEFVTVSFVTPYAWKVDLMVSWTEEVLDRLGIKKEADLFRFAYVPEKDIDPIELFTKEIHRVPFTKMYTSLI